MKILLILLSFVFINEAKLSSKQIEEVRRSGLLKVRGFSQSEQYENQQKCCFSITIQNKNKRKGYEKIKKKYTNIKNSLIKKQIISDGTEFQLLKQQIRMNNNHKVWHFKRVICVITSDYQQEYLRKILKKKQITKISFGFPNDITQQDLLMKAFNDANRKAKQLLDRIDYKIVKIQSISILNDDIQIQYPETDYSSLQYDPQVSSLSDEVKKSASDQQQKDVKQKGRIEDVEVDIVFAVKYAGKQDDEQSSSQQQAHSEIKNRSKDSGQDNDQDSSEQL